MSPMKPVITARHLRKHVAHLAETIGERNVYHPQALHRAEQYITQNWRKQGCIAEGVRTAVIWRLNSQALRFLKKLFLSAPITIKNRLRNTGESSWRLPHFKWSFQIPETV